MQGDIIIAPNFDAITENGQNVGYIKFMTSYGRLFEAGNIKYKSYDSQCVFSADKSFMAGVFGRQSNVLVSLGFILYKKFTSVSFTSLKWPS